jgi:Spermidine synthase
MDQLATPHLGAGKKAYFVGGGAYTLPRAWGYKHPEMLLTIAEVDPAVTQMARSELWYEPTDRTIIFHGDGRAVLRQLTSPQNVIIGDAFHDLSVPQHLTSLEFAQEISAKLTEDGLYLLNIVDHAQRPRFMLSVLKSLAEVFPHVQVYSDEEALRQWGRTTFVLAASHQEMVTALEFGDKRFVSWPKDMIAQLSGQLSPRTLTDDFSPVDRLLLQH